LVTVLGGGITAVTTADGGAEVYWFGTRGQVLKAVWTGRMTWEDEIVAKQY